MVVEWNEFQPGIENSVSDIRYFSSHTNFRTQVEEASRVAEVSMHEILKQ